MAKVVRVVPGFGAVLNKQLEAAGITLAELARKARLSRQTLSRALNHDEASERTEQAIRSALDAGDGALERAQSPRRGRARASAQPNTRADGTDLVQWSDRRDSQGVLPKLVRRLIHASATSARVSFRASDGIVHGGWDGSVTNEQPSAFVPQGASYWELSTGADPAEKATDNLRKRTSDPRGAEPRGSSFVFVTSRRWPGKAEWVAEQKRVGAWKDILAYDADDLEDWLEHSPSVHRWFSQQVGIVPPEAVDLDTFWENWSGATQPPVTVDLLLSGRRKASDALRAWIGGEQGLTAVQAESRSEATAFVAATVIAAGTEEAEPFFARALVVDRASDMRDLIASPGRLILLPTFHDPELQAAAVRAGHRVIVPLGTGDLADDGAITVQPVDREAAAKALEAVGIPREKSYQVAGLVRRSLSAYRRGRAVGAALGRPAWARPGESRAVIPALLAGGWSDRVSVDRDVMAALARSPYEEAVDRLTPWTDIDDALLRRRGNAWYLAAPEDAWSQLRGYLRDDDLERFRAAAISVLTSVDPAYDLEPSRRWLASEQDQLPRPSSLLRDGIARSLALMGASSSEQATSPTMWAARTVRDVLDAANKDWRLWATLGRQLPDLAEAAPEEFIAAVEKGITGSEKVFGGLLSSLRAGTPFPSFPQSGLLWALERLAWSPQYLSRVALVLGRLAAFEPEDKNVGGLPSKSLEEIFRSWHPQTFASLDHRLHTLSKLCEKSPSVAWALMLSMLPEHHGVGHPTSRPMWRDWADTTPRITHGEIRKTHAEVIDRMVVAAGVDGQRWSELIDKLGNLAQPQFEIVVERLATLDGLSPDARGAIWNALRELIARHRLYKTAGWAIPAEAVDQLQQLLRRFLPDNPSVRFGWLFSWDATPDDTDSYDAVDHATRQQRVDVLRREAVRTVLRELGLEGCLTLARAAAEPSMVGWALASIPEGPDHEDHILDNYLSGDDPALHQMASGFARARSTQDGIKWIHGKLSAVAAEWPGNKQAALLHTIQPATAIWKLASALSTDAETHYWSNVGIHWIDQAERNEAATKLMTVGRAAAAVELLALQENAASSEPELIAKVLSASIEQGLGPDVHRSSEFVYAAARLLNILAQHGIEDEILGRLEWGLLPAVDRFDRQPTALTRLLQRDPTFFVEIVTQAFRGEGEEPVELSEAESQQVRNAYQLLHDWNTPPGLRDGQIDANELNDWVDRARALLAERGRIDVGDSILGQVLSGSPSDTDGSWPAVAVRDLIERLESERLEQGVRIGLYNSRGVVTKHPVEGGGLERGLAQRYEGLAAAVRGSWPRTAKILQELAEEYHSDARREDVSAGIREDLGL